MSCTKRFLGFEWQHHSWAPRVTFAEVLTSQDTNMWARPVYRDYARCDKAEVCTECGAIGRRYSCNCDMERAERCEPRLAWLAAQQAKT